MSDDKDLPVPATKVKHAIQHLEQMDPDAYLRLPHGLGIPRFFEEKPGYYDGGYWYYDHDEDQYAYTRKGVKVDVHVQELNDLVWLCDGDMDEIRDTIRIDDGKDEEEFWDKIEKEAKRVRRFEEESIERFTTKVLRKMAEGYHIVQSIDDDIGRHNVMWYHEKGDDRRTRFDSNGMSTGDNNLNQGSCRAVIKSGLFEPTENKQEGLIYWKLKLNKNHLKNG